MARGMSSDVFRIYNQHDFENNIRKYYAWVRVYI